MTRRRKLARPVALAVAVAFGVTAVGPVRAQSSGPAPGTPTQGEAAPSYKPPLRGAPGGRVGGASRSAAAPRVPLPMIQLLAPADHAGITARPDPTLYFIISQAAGWPTQLTISAPMQAEPLVEATIPSPAAPGLYPLPLAAYRVHLQSGVPYTWSVSVVLDPHAWSRNIVASATIEFNPALATAAHDAGSLAAAGLWYDAVAAAAEAQARGNAVPLAGLMQQAGLRSVAASAAPTQ